MSYELEYTDLIHTIIKSGDKVRDRTEVGTRSLFGGQMHIDLTKGFPALTVKELKFKGVVSELLWFLEGSQDERRLAEIHYGKRREELIGKRTIWTDNADNQGKALGYYNDETVKLCGPIYGVQWYNQIDNVIHNLKNNPHSRRHIVNSWRWDEIDNMALPPCHVMYQFHVNSKKQLSCHMYQRSCDLGLGVPFNIASYALLTHMVAQVCEYSVGNLILSFGDMHVYENHVEALQPIFEREPFARPTLWLNPEVKNIYHFTMDDVKLLDYNCHPHIKLPMAV